MIDVPSLVNLDHQKKAFSSYFPSFFIKRIIFFKHFFQNTTFSTSNSKTFLFLQFLFKPLFNSTFPSLKWGFLTFIWNLVLDFLNLKLKFPLNFRSFRGFRGFRDFCEFCDLKMGFLHLKWKNLYSFMNYDEIIF